MAGGEITIRSCRLGEEQAILDLWASARSDHASTPDRPEDVESLLAGESPAALLVAEVDGRIVGAVIAGWDGWRGNIYRLTVRDDHHRMGIGIALTRAAEDYFRSRGVDRVTALVAFDDGAAGAFWDAAGYPEDQEIGPAGPQHPAILVAMNGAPRVVWMPGRVRTEIHLDGNDTGGAFLPVGRLSTGWMVVAGPFAPGRGGDDSRSRGRVRDGRRRAGVASEDADIDPSAALASAERHGWNFVSG